MPMTPEQAQSASHEFLRKHEIEINFGLPLLESWTDLSPQDACSTARRCMVLWTLVGIGVGGDALELKAYLEEFGLWDSASNEEQELLSRSEHTEQETINATWSAECVQALAWCLGMVELNPFHHCDDNLASRFPGPFTDPRDFIQSAKLRPFDEIYQQADLHYRLHWATRNAQLHDRSCVLEDSIILERRRALDWVIGVEADWDDLSLNT